VHDEHARPGVAQDVARLLGRARVRWGA
jgi:hypothetical protein